MKRLTISMSDALFDKLNQVENKSLFIRNLIEGELQKGISASSDNTYESLVGDIEDLQHELQSISSRLVSIENQLSGAPLQSPQVSDHESMDASLMVPPAFAENVDAFSNISASVNASVNDGMSTEITCNSNESNAAVFSDVTAIQVNTSAQDTDKILAVHSDGVHNALFCSVINVGMQEETLSNLADTIEKHVTSTLITSDAAISSNECLCAPVNNSTPSFDIPELSDVAAPTTNTFEVVSSEVSTPSFVMPEISEAPTPVMSLFSVTPREVPPDSSPFFTMPELPGRVGQSNPSLLEMSPTMSVPSEGNDIKMPLFAATNLPATGIQMQSLSFMQQEVQAQPSFGSVPFQPHIQNNDSSRVNISNVSQNEKLQGNILMYLPHGARIKRSIIKGLVSKKFSAEEIDAQINLMISNCSLLVEVEDGTEHLLRP